MTKKNRQDVPQAGKVYALTGDSSTPSVARGDGWQKSEVKPQFSDYEAVGIAEGFEPCDNEATYFAAWQHLINTGLVWKLRGFFGRTAKHLIDSGRCTAKAAS